MDVKRRKENRPRTTTVEFTDREMFIIRDALESYWFDCEQKEDERLEAEQPAVEALGARVEQLLRDLVASP